PPGLKVAPRPAVRDVVGSPGSAVDDDDPLFPGVDEFGVEYAPDRGAVHPITGSGYEDSSHGSHRFAACSTLVSETFRASGYFNSESSWTTSISAGFLGFSDRGSTFFWVQETFLASSSP